MERRNTDELYSPIHIRMKKEAAKRKNLRCEGRYHGVYDQEQEEPSCDRRLGEPVHDQSRYQAKQETGPERINPWTKRLVAPRPFSRKPASGNLEGKVDEDSDSHIFTLESLFDHFERGRCVIGCKAKFGEEVHANE